MLLDTLNSLADAVNNPLNAERDFILEDGAESYQAAALRLNKGTFFLQKPVYHRTAVPKFSICKLIIGVMLEGINEH